MKKLFILLLLFPAVLLAQPETVNVGTVDDDGTGDPLKTAFQKVNTNDGAAFDTLALHLIRLDNLNDSIDNLVSYTFEDGLTESDGTVIIHGTKDGGGQTWISVEDESTNFSIQTDYPSNDASAKLELQEGEMAFRGYALSGFSTANGNSWFIPGGSTIVMSYEDAANDVSKIQLSGSSMLVQDDIGLRGLVYNADYSANSTDSSLIDKAEIEGLIVTGEGSIKKQISFTTCPDNTTTNITIGTTTSDASFMIHYIAERDMTVVLRQSGTIEVQYDATTNVYYTSSFLGPSLDMTIEADFSGTDIRLNIIVGSFNTNDLSFDYKITSKFYD